MIGQRWVTASSGFAVTIVMFNNTSMNLSLPVVANDLGMDSTQMRLIVVTYTAFFAALLIPGGFLADRFGVGVCMRAGLSLTAVAGVGGALAETSTQLLVARAALGCAAALVTPASLIAVVRVAPDAQRAKAITLWTAVTVVGTALGQVLGGFVVTSAGWPAVFWVTTSGASAALAASVPWPSLPGVRTGRMPLAASAMFAAGLLCAVPALNLLTEQPGVASVALVVGLASVSAVLGRAAWRHALFGTMTRGTLLGQLLNGSTFFATAGTLFVLTQVLQSDHGFSPLGVAATTVPITAATVVGASLSGVIARRVGTYSAATGGLVTIAAACAVAAAVTGLPTLLAVIVMAVGFGVGVVMPVATTLVVNGADEDRIGTITAANDAVQEIGFALGVSAIGTVFASHAASQAFEASPGAAAYLTQALVIAAVAIAVALAVRYIRPRPRKGTSHMENSMSPRGPWADLARSAAERGDAVAIRDEAGAVTYSELVARATDLATRLHRLGVRRGDRVVLLPPASTDAAAAVYAVWRLGAVAVPLHSQTTLERVAAVVADCEPVAVVRIVDDLCAGPADSLDLLPDPGHRTPADLVCLMYTSGSTSTPKGVRCPASAVAAALAGIAEQLRYRASDVVCLVSPLSFDYGLYQLLLSVHAGAELLVAPPERPTAIAAVLREERVTVLPLVPTIASMLMTLLPRRGPIESVRLVTSTGAALTDDRMRALRGVFPNTQVVAMYGITECKRVSIAEPNVDLVRPGTVGLPLGGTRVEIVGPDGRAVAAGIVGEVVVYGPHVMDGYWGDTERTTQSFGTAPDGTRFLRTGDFGWLDVDGHLAIEGRRDDVFKVRGNRLSSSEVVGAVAGLKNACDVVVIPPVNDGEYVVAVTGDVTEDAVLAHLARTLEPQRMPTTVLVVSAFPVTANGKVDVRAVIRNYREGALR